MQNYDLTKDGNSAFQEAPFLWERGAEMQILQQSFMAADADTNNVLDSGELVQFSASTGRPDLKKYGNIAFQEAQFLWERGAEMQILQQRFAAEDVDTNNVPDSGEIMQFLASTGRPKFLEAFMQSYDLRLKRVLSMVAGHHL